MSDAIDGQVILDEDRRCLDAAELFFDSLADHPSPVGFRRLEQRIADARERLDQWRPGTAFESILAKHLAASWELLSTLARYRFLWPRVPVARLVEAIAGPSASVQLETYVRKIDPERVWEYLEARQGYRAGRIDPGEPEARQRVELTASRMVETFRAWLEDRGWELPGIDAEVVVGPPDSPNSHFRPRSHRVVLGGAEFMVFESASGPRVNPVIALHSLAHELAGHAVQDALCSGLPAPLRPDDRARLRYAALPAAEGFAARAAGLAIDFAETQGAELGIEDGDVAFLRLLIELTPLHHAVPALVAVLAARARQEPGFDAAARAAELVGHEGFGEMLEYAAVQPANKLIYECACFFGGERVRLAAEQLDSRGMERGEALRRLAGGAWALTCYDEAVLRP